jgi:hypothetical protein
MMLNELSRNPPRMASRLDSPVPSLRSLITLSVTVGMSVSWLVSVAESLSVCSKFLAISSGSSSLVIR